MRAYIHFMKHPSRRSVCGRQWLSFWVPEDLCVAFLSTSVSNDRSLETCLEISRVTPGQARRSRNTWEFACPGRPLARGRRVRVMKAWHLLPPSQENIRGNLPHRIRSKPPSRTPLQSHLPQLPLPGPAAPCPFGLPLMNPGVRLCFWGS